MTLTVYVLMAVCATFAFVCLSFLQLSDLQLRRDETEFAECFQELIQALRRKQGRLSLSRTVGDKYAKNNFEGNFIKSLTNFSIQKSI